MENKHCTKLTALTSLKTGIYCIVHQRYNSHCGDSIRHCITAWKKEQTIYVSYNCTLQSYRI